MSKAMSSRQSTAAVMLLAIIMLSSTPLSCMKSSINKQQGLIARFNNLKKHLKSITKQFESSEKLIHTLEKCKTPSQIASAFLKQKAFQNITLLKRIQQKSTLFEKNFNAKTIVQPLKKWHKKIAKLAQDHQSINKLVGIAGSLINGLEKNCSLLQKLLTSGQKGVTKLDVEKTVKIILDQIDNAITMISVVATTLSAVPALQIVTAPVLAALGVAKAAITIARKTAVIKKGLMTTLDLLQLAVATIQITLSEVANTLTNILYNKVKNTSVENIEETVEESLEKLETEKIKVVEKSGKKVSTTVGEQVEEIKFSNTTNENIVTTITSKIII